MTYEKFIETYIGSGFIKKQRCDYRALEKLILRARKDIKTAKFNLSEDEEVAYTIAYTAMLRAGRALMLLFGFRPADRQQHKTVVEFAGYFLGKEFEALVGHFDKMRKKRNIFTCEANISISKTEAENALSTAIKFVNLIEDTIKKQDPQIRFDFQ